MILVDANILFYAEDKLRPSMKKHGSGGTHSYQERLLYACAGQFYLHIYGSARIGRYLKSR
jgi:hypothetical protein